MGACKRWSQKSFAYMCRVAVRKDALLGPRRRSYSVLHAPVQVRQVVQQLRSPLETNKHQASVGIETCVKV